METKKFRTTIKCSGCVAKVTPYLNEAVGENNWSVDYNHPAKLLTVNTDRQAETVIDALQKAGYKGESLNEKEG